MTHVTGIACGSGVLSRGRFAGAAPEAHIISLKILDRLGQGSSTAALMAFRWIMDNASKYNIKIINLSIGTNDQRIHTPLREGVEQLWEKGFVVAAAAANPDGNSNFQPPPLLSPRIITVGAWEDRAYFQKKKSLRSALTATMPDLWAKGEEVVSVLSPDFDFSLQNRDRGKITDAHYIRMSGASMATPAVSGMAALLLERYPTLSPDQVKARLLADARGGLLTPEVMSF
ncbi:S8 family serine peptidase [Anaerotignum lactatifermentans]|uniref:S8 family serine peptidase n=1 Tax=Anaerotignum lactatifermentans TaxID=160404 RepID=A0ABS2GAD2_9FIRM|nr:S8 family serine peptidase [Anaerotignum lactatifermentans]MBM6878414.1 S8 family serine peptidase [Anaerotignum lactatifermentans]MBM6951568.1 S8 family serine peptidase [Anaerotignum lactatifermentans]